MVLLRKALGDITNTAAVAGSAKSKSDEDPARKSPAVRVQRLQRCSSAKSIESRTPRSAPSTTPRSAPGGSQSPLGPKALSVSVLWASTPPLPGQGGRGLTTKEAESGKAAWANALWEQRDRRDQVLPKVLALRERSAALVAAKAAAEEAQQKHLAALTEATASHSSRVPALTERLAELRSRLRAAGEEAEAEARKGRLLRLGLEAKRRELERQTQKLIQLTAAEAAKVEEGRSKAAHSAGLLFAAVAAAAELERRSLLLAENVVGARHFHNMYLSLKGNIRVFCRIRPRLPTEKEEEVKVEIQEEQRLTVHSGPQRSVTGLAEQNSSWEFAFDHVFTQSATQADVFKEISMLVQSALDGYRVAIFAYGQTGGGKTYTMDGPQAEQMDPGEVGVIPRTVDLIFSELEELREKGWDFGLAVTMLEVYNDAVYDLLSPRSAQGTREPRQIAITDSRSGFDQFAARSVSSASAVHALLRRAARERRTESTLCNDRSSRSHVIFQLSLTGSRDDGLHCKQVNGLLSLVDLAGSERLEKSGASGERMREAQHINRSLAALGDVVEALARRGQKSASSHHIPYRNSRLTMLLRDSLGGDAKALMFVNVSPCLSQLGETLSSLRFAAKVHACTVGTARRHVAEGLSQKVP